MEQPTSRTAERLMVESRNQNPAPVSQYNTEEGRLSNNLATEGAGVATTNALTNRTNLKAHEASLHEQSMHLNLQGGEISIRDDR